MKVVARQREAEHERVELDARVSGIRTKDAANESALTSASLLRVWLQYNPRAPRYVRAALEREIDRLLALS